MPTVNTNTFSFGGIKITTMRRAENDWMAFLNDQIGVWDWGSTENAAIGALIRSVAITNAKDDAVKKQ